MIYNNTTASDNDLIRLIKENIIRIANPEVVDDEEKSREIIQSASLDLRVSGQGWLMRGSSKPVEREKVDELIGRSAVAELDLELGAELKRDSVYLIKLQETVNMGPLAYVRANPKSSSGRIDLQTRLVSDFNPHYDSVHWPYEGNLYIEIVPNSFHVFLRKGTSLNQLRFSLGDPIMVDRELHATVMTNPILYTKNGDPISREKINIDNGINLTLDLTGEHTGKGIIGYRAKRSVGLTVDLQKKQQFPWQEFFEPIEPPKSKEFILEPGNFYLLSTNESINIPRGLAGELSQFDPRVGHITSHYAGFFDPGWKGTATLEARAHNKPEVVQHGQPICVLKLEPLSSFSKSLYGSERKSNYQGQSGVRYPKYFKE